MGEGSAREHGSPAMQSSVNWALLGLVIERPSYAYELARRFERTFDGALALSSVSHVYTALATLRDRGLIEEACANETATRSRRRYQPTQTGLIAHAEWIVSQVGEERRRQRVLMAQVGALAKSPQRALEVLDAFEQACLTEASAAPPAGSEGAGTMRLVARLVGEETRLTIAARLRWVQYARAQIQALDASGHQQPGKPPR